MLHPVLGHSLWNFRNNLFRSGGRFLDIFTCTFDYDHDLSLCLMLIEPFGNLGKRAAMMGFVQFRYLAGYTASALGTECLGELLQSLRQPVGRLIENHCAPFAGKRLENGLAAFLLRWNA